MQDDDVVSNTSDNRTFTAVLEARLSRRQVLAGGIGAAVTGFLGVPSLLASGTANATPASVRGGRPVIGFTRVPAGTDDTIVVPPEYTAQVLIPWGTPLFSDVEWRPDASNTSTEQARQVGSHHDGMHYFPLGNGPQRNRHGLLVLNHEYVDPMLVTKNGQPKQGEGLVSFEDVQKALAAHGVTVVEIVLEGDRWRHVVDSRFNRRITGFTQMVFSGPARTDERLVTNDPVARGTLNNCAMGYTPWNTYLACEENWDGYFGTLTPGAWQQTVTDKRYGVNANGAGYRWHEGDPRFDLAQNPNEPNRFGWVVEIDPFAPQSTPVKRTALGRFKHEGALVTDSRGRVAVYMGDDQDKEYVYKYVSNLPWRAHVALKQSPLDHGRLYVARFNADGTGEWLPLVHGEGPLTVANGWEDQADVVVRTREAADALGATKMDRPEWITQHPKTGEIYISMTNGSSGGAPNGNRPNPTVSDTGFRGNVFGNIVKLREKFGGVVGNQFEWDLWMLCGDPRYQTDVSIPAGSDFFGSPDGLWCDPDGRLWIETDVSNSTQLRADRGHDRIGNNQLLVADPDTREVKRFLVGPRGCEITGIIATPDQTSLFVNVQHPGEDTVAWRGPNGTNRPSPTNPTAVSSWPQLPGDQRPRSATVVIRRKDGGKVGT